MPVRGWSNLHTHTWRCQHASGEVDDYARIAAAGGMTVLGMSDHAPLPDGRWQDHRMRMDQLDGYIADVRGSTVPGIKLLLGLECDWDPAFASFYRDELLERRGFDYLIAGCHFTPEMPGTYRGWRGSFEHATTSVRLRAYAAYAEETMASGLFAFFTHPDLIGVCNPLWTPDVAACARDICAAAVALNVPLELNGYGIRKPWVPGVDGERPGYPWSPFWEVAAEAGVQVVLSSDAHRPQDLFAGLHELRVLRDRLNLNEVQLPFLTVA